MTWNALYILSHIIDLNFCNFESRTVRNRLQQQILSLYSDIMYLVNFFSKHDLDECGRYLILCIIWYNWYLELYSERNSCHIFFHLHVCSHMDFNPHTRSNLPYQSLLLRNSLIHDRILNSFMGVDGIDSYCWFLVAVYWKGEKSSIAGYIDQRIASLSSPFLFFVLDWSSVRFVMGGFVAAAKK